MASIVFKRSISVLAVTALAFGLAACGKSDDNKTAGQKLDSAVAQTQQAASDAGNKIEEGAAKAGAALDDAGITAQVKTDLIKAPEISALQINVDTKAGAVTLSGTVPTDAIKTQAGDIAKAAKGVTSVNNNLTVKAG